LLLSAALPLAAADTAIVKPPDGGWLPGTSVQIIAKGESGKLQLDGKPLAVDEPFPGIFSAVIELAAGSHRLRFESSSGVSEITFHSGVEPASGAGQPYTDHPPARIACTHCHSLSRRGRFRFSGGCQSCHAKETFIKTHSHEPHELASCGMCHDAHGSATAQLLRLPKEQACKQCHN
jgi:predicted CXXCH cytochrome family protein